MWQKVVCMQYPASHSAWAVTGIMTRSATGTWQWTSWSTSPGTWPSWPSCGPWGASWWSSPPPWTPQTGTSSSYPCSGASLHSGAAWGHCSVTYAVYHMQCILCSVSYCTLYNLLYGWDSMMLYSMHDFLWFIFNELYVLYSNNSIYYTPLYPTHCWLHFILYFMHYFYALYSKNCIPCSILNTLYPMLCILFVVLYALNKAAA